MKRARRRWEGKVRGTTDVNGRPAAPAAGVPGFFCNPRAEPEEEEEGSDVAREAVPEEGEEGSDVVEYIDMGQQTKTRPTYARERSAKSARPLSSRLRSSPAPKKTRPVSRRHHTRF